ENPATRDTVDRRQATGWSVKTVRIVNLHYADTVEADVYLALRKRIKLFESVVGRLQPILAQLPRTITNTVLRSPPASKDDRKRLALSITHQVDELNREHTGLDL